MARNGSGTYAIPNSFAPGETISSSLHNQNFTDLGSEITNSLAKDGQTTMTGPIKAASGTVSSPSITFGTDTDTGLYRIGANNVGIAAGGTKVGDISSTAASFTGDVQRNSFSIVPLGVIFPYAGSSAPSGWFLCYGQEVSRTTYADLFAIIGTTYGTGDGSTTFNLPDLRGRIPAGLDNMGGSSAARLSGLFTSTTLGNTFVGSVTIAQGNLPNVNFSVTDTHAHAAANSGSPLVVTNAGGTLGAPQTSPTMNVYPNTSFGAMSEIITSTTSSGSITVSSGGSGTALATAQPTLVLNYIIFAGGV